MKRTDWLLCLAKNYDWFKRITQLSNLKRGRHLYVCALTDRNWEPIKMRAEMSLLYNGSYTIMARPIKALELHYPMIWFKYIYFGYILHIKTWFKSTWMRIRFYRCKLTTQVWALPLGQGQYGKSWSNKSQGTSSLNYWEPETIEIIFYWKSWNDI